MTRMVAVLGANGFIGSRAIEMMSLLKIAEVRPVVRRPAALASSARFSLAGRIADARDAIALEQAFAGCDCVVHVRLTLWRALALAYWKLNKRSLIQKIKALR